MKIQIRQVAQFSYFLHDYVERRVGMVLGRFGEKLKSIKITLRDLNGPKGGLDKKCQVTLKLKNKLIVLEGIERDFYTVVDFTLERLSRKVAKELGRFSRIRYRGFKYGL